MQRRVLKHTDTQTHRQTDRRTDAHSHTTTPLGSLQQAGTWRAPADVILDRSGHSAGAADWTTGQLASTTTSSSSGGGRHIRDTSCCRCYCCWCYCVCVCGLWLQSSVSARLGQSVSRQHCNQHYSHHLCQRFAPCGT